MPLSILTQNAEPTPIGWILLAAVLGVLVFGFWIWMLLEAATKEPSGSDTKIVWVVIIAVTQIIGALLYFFARRPKRKAEVGR